jgi:acetylornithine deacetylase/succinyl-diaminopimelate desuccinylase-like protein
VQRYRLTVTTPGGHSWVDYGEPSAIHELAQLITRLTAIPMSLRPRTTLNVGMIQGGVSINTIAPRASLELDLRADAAPALARLVAAVEDIIDRARRDGLALHAEVIGRRPSGAIAADHPLVRLAERSLVAQGLTPALGIGSTDANIPLSRGLPAVCIGLTRGGGAHTANEWIQLAPIEKGVAQLLDVARGAYELAGP